MQKEITNKKWRAAIRNDELIVYDEFDKKSTTYFDDTFVKTIGEKNEKEIKDKRSQLDVTDTDQEWEARVKKYKDKEKS